jgi:hypothetical protein
MTSSRSLARSPERCLDKEREDLESLFADVVMESLGEKPETVTTGSEPDAAVAGGAAALLAIHDESDGSYLGVHLRVSSGLARRLVRPVPTREDATGEDATAEESTGEEPAREDLLEAIAALGDVAGDRLRTLLFTAARLSLPSATLDEVGLPPAREGSAAPTVLRAVVAGEVAELALVPHVEADGLAWPPSESEVLEAQE